MKVDRKAVFFLIAFVFFSYVGELFAEDWKAFRINAQYRGAVKKSFSNIGCALAWFCDLADGNTQIITHVCAKDPDKRGKFYAFKLNLVVNCTKDQVRIVNRIYSNFEGVNPRFHDEIEQLMAIWCSIRKFSSGYQDNSRELFSEQTKAILVDKIHRNKRKEVNLRWEKNRGVSGKFFYTYKPFPMLEKFRIRNRKISISFVTSSMKEVVEKFSTQPPFREFVFEKNITPNP